MHPEQPNHARKVLERSCTTVGVVPIPMLVQAPSKAVKALQTFGALRAVAKPGVKLCSTWKFSCFRHYIHYIEILPAIRSQYPYDWWFMDSQQLAPMFHPSQSLRKASTSWTEASVLCWNYWAGWVGWAFGKTLKRRHENWRAQYQKSIAVRYKSFDMTRHESLNTASMEELGLNGSRGCGFSAYQRLIKCIVMSVVPQKPEVSTHDYGLCGSFSGNVCL